MQGERSADKLTARSTEIFGETVHDPVANHERVNRTSDRGTQSIPDHYFAEHIQEYTTVYDEVPAPRSVADFSVLRSDRHYWLRVTVKVSADLHFRR